MLLPKKFQMKEYTKYDFVICFRKNKNKNNNNRNKQTNKQKADTAFSKSVERFKAAKISKICSVIE